jgi:hypothetical protein
MMRVALILALLSVVAPPPRSLAQRLRRETHDGGRLTVREARAIVHQARQGGLTAAERRTIQRVINQRADQFTPGAMRTLHRIAPQNSAGTVRAQVRRAMADGTVTATEARELSHNVRRDGFTAAERRELLRQTARVAGHITPGGQGVLDRLRTTPDRHVRDPFNQRLPSAPGDAGNRLGRRGRVRLHRIAPGTHLYDGAGNDRGVIADERVPFNYGQRTSFGGAPHLYAFAVRLMSSTASGWIPESALLDGPLTSMPTIDAPRPPRGDRASTWMVTGGTAAIHERLESRRIKVAPNIDRHARVAATDYLRRAGDVVNLCYNLPGVGGVATDTVPVGSTFVRAAGVRAARVRLYWPESRRRYGRMTFVYGRVDDRYGWISLDALAAN